VTHYVSQRKHVVHFNIFLRPTLMLQWVHFNFNNILRTSTERFTDLKKLNMIKLADDDLVFYSTQKPLLDLKLIKRTQKNHLALLV